MKRNGFVFVESIVAVVILTSSLLLLYSTFSNVLQSEKTRVYYDDINYIYRTEYLKKRFVNLNLNNILDNMGKEENKYFITLGLETPGLFEGYEKDKNLISNMLEDYEVSQIVVIKENKLDNLKKCTAECSLNTDCKEYANCNNLYMNLSEDFINYLKTIYVDVESNYIFVGEYLTCTNNKSNCRNYYSWVSV